MGKRRLQRGAEDQIARECVDRIVELKSLSEIRPLMEEISRELGFRYFAIIHHDDLRSEHPGLLNINNYPAIYRDIFIERQLFRVDPMIHACFHTCVGFRWSEVSKLIYLNHAHREILARAAREGLAEGITVPSAVVGERSGSCSMGGPRDDRVMEHRFLATQLVGAFAYEAARRLAKAERPPVPERPKLSRRQRECAVLAGRGKKDLAIADELGISYRTVVNHLDAARKRYRVSTREQLVISAVLDGDISLAELDTRRW